MYVGQPKIRKTDEVRKAGSKWPASKEVQQEGKKRDQSVQIKASEHKHIPNINRAAFPGTEMC